MCVFLCLAQGKRDCISLFETKVNGQLININMYKFIYYFMCYLLKIYLSIYLSNFPIHQVWLLHYVWQYFYFINPWIKSCPPLQWQLNSNKSQIIKTWTRISILYSPFIVWQLPGRNEDLYIEDIFRYLSLRQSAQSKVQIYGNGVVGS